MSMAPLLRGEHPADWRDALYYHYYEYPAEHMVCRHYGVRDDRYKLIHFYNDVDQWELYDLQEDPTEMHNIYGQPGTEEVTARMMAKLKALQEQYDDPIRFTYPGGISLTYSKLPEFFIVDICAVHCHYIAFAQGCRFENKGVICSG